MKLSSLYLCLLVVLTLGIFILIFFQSVPYLKFIVDYLRVNSLTLELLLLAIWIPAILRNSIFTSRAFIFTLLLCLVGESVAKTTLSIYRELKNIALHPSDTYDQKMTRAYGTANGFYFAVKEVARLTPTNAIIYIPPQTNPWEYEGNAAFLAYFLYPRTLVNLSLENPSFIFADNVYVLISSGSWEKTGIVELGWPKIPIAAKNLWKISAANQTTINYSTDYDPTSMQWQWGLIEVKHD